MRMRRKKNLDRRFAACAKVMIEQPEQMQGRWQTAFENDAPLHLEIGCGKGRFAIEMAKKHPEINFIAAEREPSALIVAAECAAEQPLPNLRFVILDAVQLAEYFAEGEVSRIYLNFSDPWPPNRQRKRRLTYRSFLAQYKHILQETGEICFKTDNQRFFEWSIEEFCQDGWLLQNISLDLHQSDFEQENIRTEYEQKFAEEGMRIYRLEARRHLPQFYRK